ncbi:MAG: 50S ribosomal protein L22 [Candidatus Methanofastidiosia archaeon]
MVGYSFTEEIDATQSARVYGKELRISPKHATEISREIKGMRLQAAKQYLEDVIKMKRAVAFRKYNLKVGHKKGLRGWDAGRYPVKASQHFLKLINEIQANAEYKGLDIEKLRIIHASSSRGRVLPGWIPRSHGRSSPYNQVLTNVEIIVEER